MPYERNHTVAVQRHRAKKLFSDKKHLVIISTKSSIRHKTTKSIYIQLIKGYTLFFSCKPFTGKKEFAWGIHQKEGSFPT